MPASERTKLELGSVDDRLLSVFERCFTESLVLRFGYTDRHGARTTRRIECVALVLNAPAWYVVAWDLDKDAPRTFRMDRMSESVAGGPLTERHPLTSVIQRTCPGAQSAFAEWAGRAIG